MKLVRVKHSSKEIRIQVKGEMRQYGESQTELEDEHSGVRKNLLHCPGHPLHVLVHVELVHLHIGKLKHSEWVKLKFIFPKIENEKKMLEY